MNSYCTVTYEKTNGKRITRTVYIYEKYIYSSYFGNYYTIEELNCKNTELTEIRNSFLRECENLTTLILPSTIKRISDSFLRECTKIENLDLSHLTNLTDIKNEFLMGCTNLKTLILPPTIKQIGKEFLQKCTNIKELNLSHLLNLTHIDSSFLSGCTNLEKLTLPPNIQHINYLFLERCSNIKNLNLSHLKELTIINNQFLNNCTKLETLLLPPAIKNIYNYFLHNCTNITELNLFHFTYDVNVVLDVLLHRSCYYPCKYLNTLILPSYYKINEFQCKQIQILIWITPRKFIRKNLNLLHYCKLDYKLFIICMAPLIMRNSSKKIYYYFIQYVILNVKFNMHLGIL